MKFPFLSVLSFASAWWLAPSVCAEVEFSDFGEAGDPYVNVAQYIQGSDHGGYQAYAAAFTASFTGMLSSVEVPVIGYDAGTAAQSITLVLYPNNPATNLPLTSGGITLGTIVAPTSTDNDATVETLTPQNGLTVPFAEGTSYWLALTPADSSTVTGWDSANQGAAARMTTSTDGGMTFQGTGSGNATAFEVDAVPEPSTCAMMLGAFGAFASVLSSSQEHRRERAKVRPGETPRGPRLP